MKKGKRTLILLLAALFGVGVIIFLPISFSIGRTHVEKSFLKLDKEAATIPQGFQHLSWDGPTGSLSSGDIYSFRIGDWVWRFDFTHEGVSSEN